MNVRTYSVKYILFKVFGCLLAIAVIWFLYRNFSVSWEQLQPHLSKISLRFFLLASVVYAIAFLVTGWNWMLVQYRVYPGISRIYYLDIHVTTAFARYLPGGIWNIVGKAVWCNRLGAPAKMTGAGIVVEYLFQIMSSCVFLLFFLPEFWNWNRGAGILLLTAGICGIVFLSYWCRLGFRLWNRLFKNSVDFDLPVSFLYQLLGRYLFAWLITGTGILLLATALTGETQPIPVTLVFAYPVAWVIGFLSPSPNGLGIRELVLHFLLSSQMDEPSLLLLLLTARCWTIAGEIIARLGLRLFRSLENNF